MSFLQLLYTSSPLTLWSSNVLSACYSTPNVAGWYELNSPDRQGNVSPDRALHFSFFFFSSDASLASSLSFSPGLRELSKQRQKPRSVNEPWLLALELWGFGLFLDEIEAGLESLLGSQRGEFPLLPPHNCDTACNSQGNDCGIQEIPVQCCDKFLWIFTGFEFFY